MRNKFIKYLEDIKNSDNKLNKYKLVLMKVIFNQIDESGYAKLNEVVKKYKNYFVQIKGKNNIIDIYNIDELSINDVWNFIKNNIYKELNEQGYLKISKDQEGLPQIFVPQNIYNQLSSLDLLSIVKSLDEIIAIPEISFDDDKTGIQHDVLISKNNKKILTQLEKLQSRINKQFQVKKFIGDIPVDDEEYKLLLEYFKARYNTILDRDSHILIDPVFATAMVHIGIRKYDSNYWGNLAKEIGYESIKRNHQTWIASSFIDTLEKYNKLIYVENERVNNILMHGFVSDCFAGHLFDFLFSYYRLDLERDLDRNDKESFNTLIGIMRKNDLTGRNNMLVRQIADAINVNTRGCKIRIRRLIKMIDMAFWDNYKAPVNSNRITKHFNDWVGNSQEFKGDYEKYNGGRVGRGKRRFRNPYLKWVGFNNMKFQLNLPSQLIKTDSVGKVNWQIDIGGEKILIPNEISESITGYKTEECSFEIGIEHLFSNINIELVSEGQKLKNFRVKSDCIRFFDKDGDFIAVDNLSKGEIFSVSKDGDALKSEAICGSEKRGGLVLSSFILETGDIIWLPDGSIQSIGKKIEEGLLERGLSAGVSSNGMPIYGIMPSLIIKIPQSKVDGTVIKVNDKLHRLADIKYMEIDLYDRSEDKGYQISLKDLNCNIEGVYNIAVDVPNDKKKRNWSFLYLRDFQHTFEGSPYIFKTKGTLVLNREIELTEKYKYTFEKIKDENKYNFIIKPGEKTLVIEIIINKQVMEIAFILPVLNWRFDNGPWQVEKPSEIWHTDFPLKMNFIYHEDKLRLSMDEQFDNEDSDEDDDERYHDQSTLYDKNKTLGYFDCDVTRIKSWFNKDIACRTLSIELDSKRIEFLSIITRSVVVSHLIKGYFETNELEVEFDIIGKAKYYADVIFKTNTLADKIPLVDGAVRIPSTLISGEYTVKLFEDEVDDSGFGESYYLLGEYTSKLINPKDLVGRNVHIKHVKRSETSQAIMPLTCGYIITKLQKLKGEVNKYEGKMTVEGDYGKILNQFMSIIEFYDLNKLKYAKVTFPDNKYNDEEPFLYDNVKGYLVKEERKNLPTAERYRRYDVLYPEEFVFEVKFINNKNEEI